MREISHFSGFGLKSGRGKAITIDPFVNTRFCSLVHTLETSSRGNWESEQSTGFVLFWFQHYYSNPAGLNTSRGLSSLIAVFQAW